MENHSGLCLNSELYASALNSLGTAAVITDQDAKIIYINESFEDITGYSAKEAIGQKMSLLKSGYQSKEFYAELWSTIQSTGQWKGTLWNKRKNGDVYHERLNIRIFMDSFGKSYYVGIFSDISEQDELQRALIDAQKRELMVTMIGGIAHNFNNYMTAVQGLTYLGGKLAKDENMKLYFSKISHVTEKNAHLVKSLMNISRPSGDIDASFDLIHVVKQSTETSKSILPESIELTVQMPKEGECIVRHGDGSDLEQVVLNLINNARDALDNVKDPRIVVGVFQSYKNLEHCRRYCPRFSCCPVNTEKNVIIKVEDNGCGIPEDKQDNIFTPFFTTKEPDKGTGLGLASVNQVVNRLGGAIWLTSLVNVGTQFFICLPRVDTPSHDTMDAT